MFQTTTIAVIAGGAVVLLLIGMALRARTRRRHRSGYADLPALLYFAGADPRSADGATAPRPAGAVPGWPLVRPAARAQRAVAWAPQPDERIQLLPGCLRPESEGEEIRFAGHSGATRFTLGRSRGPAHSHIQLSAATASRMHAWLELSGGQWHVGRLSQTNDVVVNGTPITLDAAQPLHDGDRLELGDMAFTFHHPGRGEATDADD